MRLAHLSVAAFVFAPPPQDVARVAFVAPAVTCLQPVAEEAPPAAPVPTDASWWTGPNVGEGVAMKDTGTGNNVFIAYAGYRVSLQDAEAWVDALYDAYLKERGVRYLWAVRGPDDSHYEHKEIGNTKIGARLRVIAPAASFILVAGHSSGSCVAHELFKQLAEGRDPEGATAGKIIYYNLDGIEKGLTPGSVARLKKAYFVAAVDGKTVSPNEGDMRRTAAAYGGTFIPYDAHGAGCMEGASWCLHVSLVNNAPHDKRAARAHLDYSDFATAGVATTFFRTMTD
jgi:hypothetical protein